MRTLAPVALALLCVLVGQQAQAQQSDQVPPMPSPEQAPVLLETYTRPIAGLAAVLPPQGTKRSVVAALERCAEAPVDVTAASPDQRRLACSAANNAIQLLGRCGISVRKPLHVHIMSEVRHPFGGAIFGLFDTKQERVLVTQEANIPSLVEGTPYAKLPHHDFYWSLIVHEVIHGVMHQNLKRPATSHAAYEYPAYVLQIQSLSPNVRDEFLHSFDQKALKDRSTLFNDLVLFADPYFFAARAYHHFKASPNGCGHLTALLEGEVTFIAPPLY